MPWLAIAAGAKLLGGIFGAISSRRAAKDTLALADANAGYIKAESAEEGRRLAYNQERTRGTVRATIAASGFKSGKDTQGASSKAYESELKDVQQRELNWIYQSGRSRADIARRGGT